MELKKVYSSIIPFNGNKAMTVYPWVFIRKEYKDRFYSYVKRHETTHGYQQIECFILGVVLSGILLILGCGWWSLVPLGLFWELYVLEWLLKIPLCFVTNKDAYCSISFEQEAIEHEWDKKYNDDRKHFAWMKYIFKLRKRKILTLEEYERIKAEDPEMFEGL